MNTKEIDGVLYEIQHPPKSLWLGDKVIHDGKIKTVTSCEHLLVGLNYNRYKLYSDSELIKIIKPLTPSAI